MKSIARNTIGMLVVMLVLLGVVFTVKAGDDVLPDTLPEWEVMHCINNAAGETMVCYKETSNKGNLLMDIMYTVEDNGQRLLQFIVVYPADIDVKLSEDTQKRIAKYLNREGKCTLGETSVMWRRSNG